MTDTITVSTPDHHGTLVAGLWHLLQSSRGVDCMIQWSGRTIRAHRFILDVFLSPANLAMGDVPEDTKQCVRPNDTALDCAVEFLYKGRADVRRDQMAELMEVAREWNFRMLIDALDSANVRIRASKRTSTRLSAPETKDGHKASTAAEAGESDHDISAALQICETQFGDGDRSMDSRVDRLKLELERNAAAAKPRRRRRQLPVRSSSGRSVGEAAVPERRHPPKSPDDDSGEVKLDRLFKCEVCGKIFKRRSDLNDHSRIHSGEKPYKCLECPKTFATDRNLVLHVRSHTGERPFECKDCGKKFAAPSNLKVHSRIHSGQRPYQCDVCGRSFTQLVALKVHALCHRSCESEKRPFPCQHCEKRLPTPQSLKIHMRAHTGEKPYVCVGCGKAFGRIGHLSKHERNRACGRSVGRRPKSLTESDKV